MPRIPDEILNCAVYIYGNPDDAREGERVGGTGFVVAVWSMEEPKGFGGAQLRNRHLYIVTNWHVIFSAEEHPVVRLNTTDGGTEILETEQGSWIRHPNGDDLAVYSITLSEEFHKFTAIDQTRLLGMGSMFEVGPGMDVFMVGRYIGHDGKQRNLPSVRFGNIAMMPLEPIEHPMGLRQESFLVEMRSIGGFSGSPVFSYIPPGAVYWGSRSPRIRRADAPLSSIEMKFIGVDWGHLPIFEPVLQSDKKTRTADLWVRSNSAMCGVVPAWKLTELLYCEELKMQREKRDKQIHERKNNERVAVLDNAERERQNPPFTRDNFEAALKKVARKKSDET